MYSGWGRINATACLLSNAEGPYVSISFRHFLPDRKRNLGLGSNASPPPAIHRRALQEGWQTGFEPATAGTTSRSSTN